MFDTFDMRGPFGAFSMHTSELDQIARDIVTQYETTGELEFNIDISPTFTLALTPMELDYIQTQVKMLIGG